MSEHPHDLPDNCPACDDPVASAEGLSLPAEHDEFADGACLIDPLDAQSSLHHDFRADVLEVTHRAG